MDSFAVCAAALLCAMAALCIRTMKPEFAPILRAAFCVLFGFWTVAALGRPVTQLRAWMEDAMGGGEGEILFRALGIATLTHITAELCRDCGESTLAGGVEMLGKLEILTLCLPLIAAVLETVGEILQW